MGRWQGAFAPNRERRPPGRAPACAARSAVFRPRAHRALAALSSLVVACVSGCGSSKPQEPDELTSSAERGPLKLTATVAPRQAWVGDPVTVDLRMRTPDDIVVALPDPNAFGDLHVIDAGVAECRPAAEGGLDWRRRYRVDSLISGTLEIPPLVAKYARREGDQPPAALDQELSTGPLEVLVRSALTTQDSIVQPRDITGTLVPPPAPWPPWLIAMVAVGTLLLLGLGAFAARLVLQYLTRPPPPISPEEWALRELNRLDCLQLIAAGQPREHYYRLSEIVRGYIERQFGLAAPEMTTEEFLTSLSRQRHPLPFDRDSLMRFMQVCDLVKYAAFVPLPADADEAMRTAVSFVKATAAASTPALPSAADAPMTPTGAAAT